jgi:broad specificity phosphatase PhoE
MAAELYLLRHGETEWTISGRHTGITEVPLTAHGEDEARAMAARFKGLGFERVLTSPRVRARHTCELAGLGSLSQVHDDLHEWIYGDYEGLLPTEIQQRHRGWNVFEHGCPNGETPADVTTRADRVLAFIEKIQGKVAVVSHGHFTRALALRWVKLPIAHGAVLESSTASLSVLGFSKNSGKPLIKLWNQTFTGIAAG